MEDRSKKDLDIILVALDTDKQQLADEIGEDRTIVSRVLSGQRKAPATRRKLAKALCSKVEALILPPDLTPETPAMKEA